MIWELRHYSYWWSPSYIHGKYLRTFLMFFSVPLCLCGSFLGGDRRVVAQNPLALQLHLSRRRRIGSGERHDFDRHAERLMTAIAAARKLRHAELRLLDVFLRQPLG